MEIPISPKGCIIYTQVIGWNRYRIRSIALFSAGRIFVDRVPSTDYERKLDDHAVKLTYQLIVTVILVTTSFSFALIGPIYAYIVDGTHALPTGVILPFVDPETGRGFAINLTIQLAVSSFGLVAIICLEILTCIINLTYCTMADMVCFNMRKFSDGLRQGTFSYQNKLELRNVFVQLQDLEAFLEEWNDLYYWRFFVQPAMTTLCVSLAIFAQMVVRYSHAFHVVVNAIGH